MKAFTDIKQSKKLAETIPPESADMCYYYKDDKPQLTPYSKHNNRYYIPCWSLAALLDLMQIDCKIEKTAFDQTNKFTYSIWADYFNINTDEYDELVDACVKMIIKIHEQKVL